MLPIQFISKILANRITLVIDSIVSHEHSAFIKGKQVLDGLMILNEVFYWCKFHNHQTLVFKDDFQKAYNYIHWDFY